VTFSTPTDHFTQIPSGKVDECNRDVSTGNSLELGLGDPLTPRVTSLTDVTPC
jgi:hypothetical protein